jgi:hypothetical protein
MDLGPRQVEHVCDHLHGDLVHAAELFLDGVQRGQ